MQFHQTLSLTAASDSEGAESSTVTASVGSEKSIKMGKWPTDSEVYYDMWEGVKFLIN